MTSEANVPEDVRVLAQETAYKLGGCDEQDIIDIARAILADREARQITYRGPLIGTPPVYHEPSADTTLELEPNYGNEHRNPGEEGSRGGEVGGRDEVLASGSERGERRLGDEQPEAREVGGNAAFGTSNEQLEGRASRPTISGELGEPDRKARALSEGEAVAWEGYWPGAGSIDSVTRLTRWKHVADDWKRDGAQISGLCYTSDALARSEVGVTHEVFATVRRVMEERATYFDRTKGHFDRQDTARSYRATLADLEKALSALSAPPKPSTPVTGAEGTFIGTDADRTLAALPAREVIYAKEIQVAGLSRKEVFNALTYLSRRGDLTRIGYGKYQRPPGAALSASQGQKNG